MFLILEIVCFSRAARKPLTTENTEIKKFSLCNTFAKFHKLGFRGADCQSARQMQQKS